MKIELPSAEEFCKKLDEKLGEWWSNDYEELAKRMQEYGNLCAAHGAKSIRYQSIEIVNNVFKDMWDKGVINLNFADSITREIHNLNP